MKIFKWFAVLWVTLVVACGGGGGSAGTVAGGSGESAAAVSSFVYQLSKNALTNSGADYIVLTVTALDGSHNPVPGARVLVSPDTGIYTPDASVTDEKGAVTGKLTINPNDKSDRDINAVIAVGDRRATVVVPVTGSQIALALLPATPTPGSPVRLDVKVTDINGAAIAGIDVALSGSLGFSGAVRVGDDGSAAVSLPAVSLIAGTYTVEAAGSGVTASKTVQIVSPAGGTIPDVPSGTLLSAASLSASPNTIAPNVTGSTGNRSTLKAVFRDPDNQAIQDVRVRFEVMPPGLGAGEQISTGSTVVYSDVNGVALAEYIAGTRPSPTNGVLIKACYGRTDADMAGGACPHEAQANLTVASSPLSITIGDDNTMERGNNGLTYIKDFDVAVADSAGYAITGAVLSVSVDIPGYRKAVAFDSPDGTWCPNEDANRNGFVDGLPVNEDVNGNGKLEPRKADVVVYFDGSNKTDQSGRARIKAEWAQSFATWLRYTIKVTTSVSGSEGRVEKDFVTQFIEADLENGAFRVPQYRAVPDCTNPN